MNDKLKLCDIGYNIIYFLFTSVKAVNSTNSFKSFLKMYAFMVIAKK